MTVFYRLTRYLKRHRVAVVVFCTIVAIACYVVWSIGSWNAQVAAYERWKSDIRRDVDATLALPSTNTAEHDQKLFAMRRVVASINTTSESVCHASFLADWQRDVIPAARDRSEVCERYTTGVIIFNERMQDVVRYLEEESTLSKTVSAALETQEGVSIEDEAFEVRLVAWRDTAKAVDELKVTKNFSSVKVRTQETLRLIVAGWSDVIAAHTAKDKTRYMDAQAQLAGAYDGLAGIANESTVQYTKLTTTLQGVYTEAFK